MGKKAQPKGEVEVPLGPLPEGWDTKGKISYCSSDSIYPIKAVQITEGLLGGSPDPELASWFLLLFTWPITKVGAIYYRGGRLTITTQPEGKGQTGRVLRRGDWVLSLFGWGSAPSPLIDALSDLEFKAKYRPAHTESKGSVSMTTDSGDEIGVVVEGTPTAEPTAEPTAALTTTLGLPAANLGRVWGTPLLIPGLLGAPYKVQRQRDGEEPDTLERFTVWLAGDPRGEPHTHPRPFVTEILEGGYTEHRYRRDENGEWQCIGAFTYTKGDVVEVPAGDAHVVHSVLPGTLTHMKMGKLTAGPRDWGHLVRDPASRVLVYVPAEAEPGFKAQFDRLNTPPT